MGSFTPHMGTHCFISNNTPISWASSLLRGTQCFISISERMTYPIHGNLPHTGAHNVPSLYQRGTTHPSHGHTQLMGSLSGRLTKFVSWRMSHATIIINTPSQLGRHSPSGQVSHKVLKLRLGCSRQHSLSARDVFSTRPNLSRKYLNFVLAIIINTPSQLGRYSPPGQVSHGSN
jgi:hypothetical protein